MKGLLTPLSAAPQLLQPSSWWLVQDTVEGVSQKPLNSNITIFFKLISNCIFWFVHCTAPACWEVGESLPVLIAHWLQWNFDGKCFLLVLLYSVLFWVCNRPRQNVALAGIVKLQNHYDYSRHPTQWPGRPDIWHEYQELYSWRKNCHVEKFWEILRNFGRFCHNLHAFMWRKIEPKKYICGEKWQIWGLITWCRTVVQARKSISILFFSWRAFASSIKKISEKALFNGQYEQKVRYAMPCEEIFGFLAINLFSVCLESLLLIFRYNLNLASKEIEHLLSIT